MELVSHGEHLRLAADAIERAPSVTQRELRVHTLAGTFRALSVAGEGPLPKSLSRFVDAAREAVALGHAVREPARFATALRHASELLAEAATASDMRLATGLASVATLINTLAAPAAPAPAAPAPVSVPIAAPLRIQAPLPIVPIETLAPAAPEPPPIVPIETLAPAPLEPPTPPAPPELPVEPATRPKPALPPLLLTEMSEVPAETPDLVGSWIAYERMVAAGIGPASLEELMGEAATPAAPARDTTRPTPPSLVAVEPAPAETVRAATAAVELPVVDVQRLLYRGPAALSRAQELRELAKRTPPEELPALFEEVCDLVVLAFEPRA
jgi:hypothetical protein